MSIKNVYSWQVRTYSRNGSNCSTFIFKQKRR